MSKTYHFISGLPRSGSTLLSAILNQNPNFNAGISDTLYDVVKKSHYHLCAPFENNFNITHEQKINTIQGIFDGYYKHINESVVFNTNRNWTNMYHVLNEIYPNSKIICCVRDTVSILQSFEKLYKKNTLNLSSFFDSEDPIQSNVETRSSIIYEKFIKLRILSLVELMHTPLKSNLFLLDYDELVQNPTHNMKLLYDFIGEPYFNHDFENISIDTKKYELYDRHANTPNMHVVKSKLEKERSINYLPPSVLKQYSSSKFWK